MWPFDFCPAFPSLSPGRVYSVHEIKIFSSGAGKEAGMVGIVGRGQLRPN